MEPFDPVSFRVTQSISHGSNLSYEKLRLLPGAEMAAAFWFAPMHEMGEATFGPVSKRPRELARKDRAAGRDRDRLTRGLGEPCCDFGDALPIQPGG